MNGEGKWARRANILSAGASSTYFEKDCTKSMYFLIHLQVATLTILTKDRHLALLSLKGKFRERRIKC